MTRVLCLEGITGAGKTTQSLKLNQFVVSIGQSCLVVNEKTYEPFRSVIINWHNSGANQNFQREMVESIARTRAETHGKHFLPLIGKLDYLIFDRSFYTSGVYQADGELSIEEVIQINLQEGAIVPEEGLILLCSPEIARQRIDLRRVRNSQYNLPSMHESIEEIKKRRELYLKLAKTHPELYLIDSSEKSEEEVFEEVKERLRL